jgi:hypothetical protein
MNRVYILFHNPNDDQDGKLNEALRQKNAYVDAQNRVRCVRFPDGWLVVCYDATPDDEMKRVIREKVEEVKPQLKKLFIHRTTQERSPQVTTAQSNLTLPGNVLAGARTYEYSHAIGDPIYDGLIKILTTSQLADLDEYLHREMLSRLSTLKHRIAHLFTPIDIDLQGLMASNFRPDYWEEVVAAYRETKPTRVIDEARRIKEELWGVANEDQKKVIERRWGKAEKALAKMVPLLCALETGKLDWCKEEAENFCKAFRELFRILDELDDELAKSSPETK